MGRVRRTAALDLLVAGRGERTRLRPFLHRGLGVPRGVGGDPVAPGAEDERLGRLEAAVDEHRADQRFAHVGQDRRLLAAAAPRFAEAQRDMRPDVPLERDLGAGLAPHKLGEPHRELPLARLRKGLIEPARDHHAEHPVAKKFEPLVGLRPPLPGRVLRRKMGQCELSERGIAEAIPEP